MAGAQLIWFADFGDFTSTALTPSNAWYIFGASPESGYVLSEFRVGYGIYGVNFVLFVRDVW